MSASRIVLSAWVASSPLLGLASAQIHPATTFFGGSAHDRAQGCATDQNGRVFITGNTGSTNFSAVLPLAVGGHQKQFQGTSDAFVAILSPALDDVFAWTYLGGSGEDRGYGVHVDDQGRVWVVGFTESPNFPKTTGPTWKGGKDAFVARYSPDLKQLQMCRLLGGSADENPRASFAVDPQGNVFVAGSTASYDFPTTQLAFQKTHASGGVGSWDAFVTKLSPGGQIVWSTYLGGSGYDAGYSGVAIGSDGSVIVGGRTNSSDFPTTSNAFQPDYGGAGSSDPFTSGDGFVARVSPNGQQLYFATYLGGSDDDAVSGNDAVGLDPFGRIVVIGQTASHDFPVGAGAWKPQHSPGSNRDGFIVTLAPFGKQLLNGTFLGGTSHEELSGLDIDTFGNVYVSGGTDSTDFPITADAKQPTNAGFTDAILVKFSKDLDELVYSTFVGGHGTSGYGDRGRSLRLTWQNTLVMSGDADSVDFPSTAGTFAPDFAGGWSDAFVSHLSMGDTYAFGVGKKTSQNKFATIGWTGTPSQSTGSFRIEVADAIPSSMGMLVLGDAISPMPFQGGTLYPKTPLTTWQPIGATNASGAASFPISIPLVWVGQTRVFQFLFKDVAQTDGTATAMTRALKVVFTP